MSENIKRIFHTLKQIDVKDNATVNVQKRSEAAYNKLHQLALEMGKEKQFIKLVKVYRDMAGYRDHPKYMYVVAVGLLRKKALQLGEKWAKAGRLEKPEQIFSLSVEQVSQAEQDRELPVMPMVEKALQHTKWSHT